MSRPRGPVPQGADGVLRLRALRAEDAVGPYDVAVGRHRYGTQPT
jgi:hypothetical protein